MCVTHICMRGVCVQANITAAGRPFKINWFKPKIEVCQGHRSVITVLCMFMHMIVHGVPLSRACIHPCIHSFHRTCISRLWPGLQHGRPYLLHAVLCMLTPCLLPVQFHHLICCLVASCSLHSFSCCRFPRCRPTRGKPTECPASSSRSCRSVNKA